MANFAPFKETPESALRITNSINRNYYQMSKSILRILSVCATIVLFSCSKEEVTPTAPITTSVQVEYRVSASSGNVTVYQDVPVAGQSALSEEKITVNRMTYSYTMNVVSGTIVNLRATNTNPGPEEVISEIYVNGNLLASGSANAPGAYATASGTAR